MNKLTDNFDEDALDRLYRSDPGRVWTCAEIAEAAGSYPQMVNGIERRALRKLRDEFMKRGIFDPIW